MQKSKRGLGGWGQGFGDDSCKALEIKIVMLGGGRGSKIVKSCVTSFMDDLKVENLLPTFSKHTMEKNACFEKKNIPSECRL